MKKIFMKTFFLFAALGTFSAHAETGSEMLPSNAHRFVEITAEYYPGETYYLGYTMNEDYSIDKIFYENHEHQLRYFSIQKLAKYQTIITNQTGGKVYNLVELKGEQTSFGSYHIELRYMKNGLFRNHDEANFNVFYVPSIKGYMIKNIDENELISKCHVTTNFWGSMAVGIDEIVSTK